MTQTPVEIGVEFLRHGSSAELLGEVGGSVGSTEAIEKDADAAWPAPTVFT